MDFDDQMERWLADEIPSDWLSTPLPDALANEVVNRLKEEADRYWYIDPHRSLKYANRIVEIGKARDDPQQIALGLMAVGDALKFIGSIQEAWDTIEQAGMIFQTLNDELGWARTRIGRLYLSVKINHVRETLLDGMKARKIFRRYHAHELLIRLNMARAVVYGSLGNVRRALRLLYSTQAFAEMLGVAGQQYLGQILMNIGVAHEVLGDFSKALFYYEQARSLFHARNEMRNIALIEINIAYISQAQGRYRHSLNLLHGILERDIKQFPMEYLAVKRDMTECYLYLNRYIEARELAKSVVGRYREREAAYETARSLLHLSTAEAEMGNFQMAYDGFQEAEQIFANLGATSWQALTRLRRARTILKQGDETSAIQEAQISSVGFKQHGQQVNYAEAILLKAQALFFCEHYEQAAGLGIEALHIARLYNVPTLLYGSHLLLGQIAEAQDRCLRAIRRYQAAAATIERVQRGLTITLRPGFLEDKGEAARRLIGLYLQMNQVDQAFETIEHAKSQVLLGYLLNQEHLRWDQEIPQSRALIKDLDQLRLEHQWFYRLAHDISMRNEHASTISVDRALEEIKSRERRMRAITEQLYLHGGKSQETRSVPVISLDDIQSRLAPATLLVEFYKDGSDIWAFTIDNQTIKAQRLPITIYDIQHLLAQLQVNIGTVFGVSPRTSARRNLTRLAQGILKRLYSLLIHPLVLDERDIHRMLIVPYGPLHYLPFHLLYDGSRYLIERYEIVILPVASLATRPVIKRKQGALVLAHSYDGRLPYTLVEAHTVNQICGGVIYVEENSKREALRAAPIQILHIAAHGEHRPDQPDLSYLHLDDGQLYADDLLQQDLSYELVTLSACEAGRANVVASDELIGLGRGFLYAGAGALVMSLWRVEDGSTRDFMRRMYQQLSQSGKSKAAAIREAQQSIINEDRNVHPAFWGAFQLMGNADPLSTSVE